MKKSNGKDNLIYHTGFQLPACFRLFVLCCLMTGYTACIDDVDGCLDNTASNFNAVADVDCDGCCIYPALQLNVAHRLQDSLSLAYNTPYFAYPDTNISFTISKVKFYLSNFQLVNDQKEAGVADTIQLTLLNGEQVTVEDNFSLISRDQNSFTYNLGTFRETGIYNKIRFQVGLADPVTRTNPESLSDHPLAIQSDSMYAVDLQQYIVNRLVYVPDTSVMDTITIDILASHALVDVELPLQEPFEIELGFNVIVPLKIDYWEWLKGIIFVTNPEEIKENIVTKTADAFSIGQ